MQSLYFKAFSYIDNTKPAYIGIYFSLLLHLSILLFAIGLPDFFKPKKIPMLQVIPIEILNVSNETSLTPKKETPEINKKEIKKIEQKKFNASENIEIQKRDLKEKPKKNVIKNENISNDNLVSQKSDLNKVVLKEKKIKNLDNTQIENVETLKTNKIKPKLKPKPVKKIESKSDIEIPNKENSITKEDKVKKKISKPKPIEKPEPDFNLATMLKDLRNEDLTNTVDNSDQEDEIEEKIEKNEVEENIEVSISEMDLVLQQLRGCFNPRAGTQIVGNEMVKISAKIDRNAKVRKDTVQIIDTNISKSNPYYEAITESAVATLYNPLCAKLKLPLEKYDSWKDLKIIIDYSWIKN